jgi:hypothetical protein
MRCKMGCRRAPVQPSLSPSLSCLVRCSTLRLVQCISLWATHLSSTLTEGLRPSEVDGTLGMIEMGMNLEKSKREKKKGKERKPFMILHYGSEPSRAGWSALAWMRKQEKDADAHHALPSHPLHVVSPNTDSTLRQTVVIHPGLYDSLEFNTSPRSQNQKCIWPRGCIRWAGTRSSETRKPGGIRC